MGNGKKPKKQATRRKFGKKPKDKNAPKRPATPFFVFANEVRAEIRENNPEASIGQIGKILGERWKALPEDQKAAYHVQSQKAKAEYQEVLEEFKKSEDYAAYQQKVAEWKEAKKASNKKKVVKRKK